LRAAYSPEGAQGGDQVDGLEEIGFALSIVADKEVKAWLKFNVQPGVITKISQS
jgi:hypothetical protein